VDKFPPWRSTFGSLLEDGPGTPGARDKSKLAHAGVELWEVIDSRRGGTLEVSTAMRLARTPDLSPSKITSHRKPAQRKNRRRETSHKPPRGTFSKEKTNNTD